ncbi:magnesium and cobalt transport protein CorA [Ferroglobus placidus DSM 10642]|uniref:Magnesium transport protein CorA n=1 Tax=Ferroglobus placidus (strain DSM 10642 / AEDII12DO) TaxID=589924 RepID=D3S0C7_FERPA|nr:magnesium/cobalt transporter CorA [Ferroglobus placidus]ADC66190.1 magnesium and cobalt transport protein CorA [Ferroglobus placidus DSM 10642]
MHISKELEKKIALPPATPVFVGEKKSEEVKITAAIYDEKSAEFEELKVEDLENILNYDKKLWIDVTGIHDEEAISKICDILGIHPLAAEDVLNTAQRVKVEDYDDHLFIVLKILLYDDNLEIDQLSVVLKKNLVVTFKEREYQIFDLIRSRLKKGGRIRKFGVDYLAYAIMDAVVDSYFEALLKISSEVEVLEDEVVSGNSALIGKIHGLKREILAFRNAVWPLRDVLSFFTRVEHDLIGEEVKVYYRDVYDHAVRLMEVLETQRELVVGLRELLLSVLSNKLNEIMKVLTMIATIFIPLSFIASVYGMNFKYMPELEWEYGYPTVLIVMAVIALVEVVFFKKKGWI